MGPRGPKGARGETSPRGVTGLPGVPGSKVSELFSLLIDMPMGVTLDVRTSLRCLHEYLYTYTIIIHILQHLTTKEAFTSTVVVAVCVSVDTSVSPRVPVALLYLPGSHW